MIGRIRRSLPDLETAADGFLSWGRSRVHRDGVVPPIAAAMAAGSQGVAAVVAGNEEERRLPIASPDLYFIAANTNPRSRSRHRNAGRLRSANRSLPVMDS
ncbi:hypothetical protein ACLOJK_018175 [Asimina triloba]